MSRIESDPRVSRLTQRQKDCLELVAQGYTAKEIGRKLGISYSTVNNHLQTAIHLLEVAGRKEAARLYARAAGARVRQRLPSEPRGLVSSAVVPEGGSKGWRAKLTSLLLPIGGKENALTPRETFVAIVSIAFLGTLVFIACVMVVKMSFRALT